MTEEEEEREGRKAGKSNTKHLVNFSTNNCVVVVVVVIYMLHTYIFIYIYIAVGTQL